MARNYGVPRHINGGYRTSLWPLLALAFTVVGMIDVATHLAHCDFFAAATRSPRLSVDFAALTADRTLALKLPQSQAQSVLTSALLPHSGGVPARAGMG
ncbi:MAG TPA: hypothetical protein VIL63_11230 [Terriglobales bacterium]|jgi:hypothetical protein